MQVSSMPPANIAIMVSANIHSDWLTASGFAMPMSWMAGASTNSEALMASIPVLTPMKLTEPAK